MADLYLEPTVNGPKLAFTPNGDFQTTDGLFNAGYLALCSDPWWGNQVTPKPGRFVSRFSALFNENVTPSIRNQAERMANEALEFFTTEGIASELTIEAIIQSSNYILLQIFIQKPDGLVLDFRYGLNWQAQIVEKVFAGIV